MRLSLSHLLCRCFKLAVSAAVFLCDWCARNWHLATGGQWPGTGVFLTYHTIAVDARAAFARQIDLLSQMARPLPGVRDLPLEPGLHHVIVTFDDAFQSFFLNALPVLAAANVPALLFVPTGYLGRTSTWFDYGGENAVGEEVVSAEELKRSVTAYPLEIGSHTVSHANLRELTDEEALAELRESRQALESLCQRKINAMSFPYGSGGARETKLAALAGYDFCFGVLPETLVGSIHAGLVGRVSVQPTDWDLEFKLKVLGAYRWVSRASAWKKRARWPGRQVQMKEIKLHG
jgi:peptidoglycan/xylan/chitin deacetylase (PgdA/CDA1 family)